MVNSLRLVSITQQRSGPHVGEDDDLDTLWQLVAIGCCTSSQNLWRGRSGRGKKRSEFPVTTGTWLRMLDGTCAYWLAGAD